MLAPETLLLLPCIVFSLGIETQAASVTTISRPQDCNDLNLQGKTYEGHYVVYTNASKPNTASIIYCSKNDGMDALPSGMANRETPKNCFDLLINGMTSNGVNIMYPDLEHPDDPVLVYCDQETDGGGWTVIQKRYDGSEEFYRPWIDYSKGFGNAAKEHYIGNDLIATITGQSVNELRVDLEDWDGVTAYAHYQFFQVGYGYYKLQAGIYDGTAGDGLGYHAGQQFSTYDAEHDVHPSGCAEVRHGAWWYYGCGPSSLNGRYLPNAGTDVSTEGGMYWFYFRGWQSLKASEMKVRPYACDAGATK